MKYNPMNRRMFLIGAGGSFLSIPLLTSLLPRSVEAQVNSSQPLRFIMIGSGYSPGEVPFFGPISKQLQKQGGNELINQVGVLPLKGMSNFSYILDPFFAAGLQSKISILRSLDIMAKITLPHPQAAPGCASFDDGNEGWSNGRQESVDLLIARSIQGVPEATRHVAITPQFPDGNKTYKVYSFKYDSTLQKYQQMVGINDPNFLLAKLGVGNGQNPAPSPTGISRRDILTKVFEDYNQVKKNSRLSSEDKLRLDHYMSLVSDIQNGMDSEPQMPQLACTKPSLQQEIPYPAPPKFSSKGTSSDSNYLNDPSVKAEAERIVAEWQTKARQAQDIRISNHMKIIRAALMCDVTRVVSLGFRYDGQGDMDHSYHHAGAHLNKVDDTVFARSFYSSQRRIASATAQLMKSLDEVREGTGTMLDNSIVYWAQQFACSTHADPAHAKANMPVLVGGSAGGQLNAGYFIDYRTAEQTDNRYNPRGVPLNNLLVTFLNCFGIGSSMYENSANKGYGNYGGKGTKPEFAKFNTTTARRSALPFFYKGKTIG